MPHDQRNVHAETLGTCTHTHAKIVCIEISIQNSRRTRLYIVYGHWGGGRGEPTNWVYGNIGFAGKAIRTVSMHL